MSIVFTPVAAGGQDCMVNHGRITYSYVGLFLDFNLFDNYLFYNSYAAVTC